jgi:hypothetical protein
MTLSMSAGSTMILGIVVDEGTKHLQIGDLGSWRELGLPFADACRAGY